MTPTRRCYARVWAMSARVAHEQSRGALPSSHHAQHNMYADISLSPLDIEFDKYFGLPNDGDTDTIKWKCPCNFFLFQQRAMQFKDFSRRCEPSSAATSRALIGQPYAVRQPSSTSNAIDPMLTPVVATWKSRAATSLRDNAKSWALRQ